MQLRKQNWKKIRTETPCRDCGKDHASRECLWRRGRRKTRAIP